MFLGADAVIVNRKNACGLTPAVSKVSSGALEFLPLFSVRFVSNFLSDMKQNHKFRVISTNLDEEQPQTLEEVKNQKKLNEIEELMEMAEQEEEVEKEATPGKYAKQDLEMLRAAVEKGGKKIPIKPLESLDDLKIGPDENILLILGSEGEGVSRAVSMLADNRVVIPPRYNMDLMGKYPFHVMDSLNVSVSAALMLGSIH